MTYTSGLEAKAMEKWTFKNLDNFLEFPKIFAPETAMGAVAVKSARDRRDIIEYLKA
jgi:cytochrome c